MPLTRVILLDNVHTILLEIIDTSQILHFTALDKTMTSATCHPNIATRDHKAYMEYALEKARLSPPAPTKFCVGAVLVDADRNEILSTGYSMELPGDRPGDPGNTHADQDR